jgi:hypothetical protein
MDIWIAGYNVIIIEKEIANGQESEEKEEDIETDLSSGLLFSTSHSHQKYQDESEKEMDGSVHHRLWCTESPCIEMIDRHQYGDYHHDRLEHVMKPSFNSQYRKGGNRAIPASYPFGINR